MFFLQSVEKIMTSQFLVLAESVILVGKIGEIASFLLRVVSGIRRAMLAFNFCGLFSLRLLLTNDRLYRKCFYI